MRLAAALALLAASPAPAQERVLVKGLLDTEFWNTDSGSRLLSKNEGDPAPAWRVRLWTAAQIHPNLLGFVLAETEGGKASEEEDVKVEIEQAFLRYTLRAPLRLRLEAGRIAMPIGNFPRRYLSPVNPLIGAPDAYDVSYPLGIEAAGGIAHFDYRVALIDRPVANERYVPEPTPVARPALAVGVTPTTGLRLGAYFTRGPYLNDDLDPLLPAGADWKGYDQQITGFELQFSRGHFELNGDFTWSAYEVPTQAAAVRGKAYYVEPKYTFTPRFFTALRLEQNDYAYIQPVSSAFWVAQSVNFYDVEVGLGCRLGPATVVKVAYRKDRWTVDESLKAILPDGYSVSAQISHSFDILSWFERPR